jgi:hypothetical protein
MILINQEKPTVLDRIRSFRAIAVWPEFVGVVTADVKGVNLNCSQDLSILDTCHPRESGDPGGNRINGPLSSGSPVKPGMTKVRRFFTTAATPKYFR